MRLYINTLLTPHEAPQRVSAIQQLAVRWRRSSLCWSLEAADLLSVLVFFLLNPWAANRPCLRSYSSPCNSTFHTLHGFHCHTSPTSAAVLLVKVSHAVPTPGSWNPGLGVRGKMHLKAPNNNNEVLLMNIFLQKVLFLVCTERTQ